MQRLADYLAEITGIRVTHESARVHSKTTGIILSRPQHTITSPDPEYALKKGTEEARDGLDLGDHFYYADEFNLSWMPTLKTIWEPKGWQIMIPAQS